MQGFIPRAEKVVTGDEDNGEVPIATLYRKKGQELRFNIRKGRAGLREPNHPAEVPHGTLIIRDRESIFAAMGGFLVNVSATQDKQELVAHQVAECDKLKIKEPWSVKTYGEGSLLALHLTKVQSVVADETEKLPVDEARELDPYPGFSAIDDQLVQAIGKNLTQVVAELKDQYPR